MVGKTDFHSDAILNLFIAGTFASAITGFVGLFTAAPSDTGGGTEVTDGTPPRESLGTMGNLAGASPDGRRIDNTIAIEFTNWPAGASPAAVDWAGVFDAVSSGNLRYWAQLADLRTITTGETATFAATALVIIED